MDLKLKSVQVPTPEVGLVALPCCTQGSFLCSDGPHFQKPSLQAHLQNLLGSQCRLVTYLDGLIGAGPLIFTGSDLLRSLLKPSQLTSVDLSQITATSLSVCPSPSGSLGLRYHVKTRERRGSSFSQLGLEPNHTGLTAQSLFFLEESCRVKRSDTQTFSNFSNYFKRVLKLQKRSLVIA